MIETVLDFGAWLGEKISGFWVWVKENKGGVVAVFMLTCLFNAITWGLIDGIQAGLADDPPLVAHDCLSKKGLVRYGASSFCYDESTKPREVAPENQPKKILAQPVYDPPCGPKSDAHFCADRVYSKSQIKGSIDTVTFNGDAPIVEDDHLRPDYTEVSYLPPWDDAEEQTEKFCGNVMDLFTPGKNLNMVLQETKQSDYNGCHTISVIDYTFGGKRINTVKAPHPTVPGAN